VARRPALRVQPGPRAPRGPRVLPVPPVPGVLLVLRARQALRDRPVQREALLVRPARLGPQAIQVPPALRVRRELRAIPVQPVLLDPQAHLAA